MARRNPADGAALDPALTQKKRARRRLVGALALGVAAAIVLPLVLDSEPRQTISDVEIEIPPREAALPDVDLPKPDVAVAPMAADEGVVSPSPSEPGAQGQTESKDVAPPEIGSQAEAKADAGNEVPAATRRSSKTEAPKTATAEQPKSAAAEKSKPAA